jgi:hypothetical protein
MLLIKMLGSQSKGPSNLENWPLSTWSDSPNASRFVQVPIGLLRDTKIRGRFSINKLHHRSQNRMWALNGKAELKNRRESRTKIKPRAGANIHNGGLSLVGAGKCSEELRLVPGESRDFCDLWLW